MDIKTAKDLLRGEMKDETTESLNIAYRDLALIYHPDKGGTKEAFQTLVAAKELIESELLAMTTAPTTFLHNDFMFKADSFLPKDFEPGGKYYDPSDPEIEDRPGSSRR